MGLNIRRRWEPLLDDKSVNVSKAVTPMLVKSSGHLIYMES